MFSKNTVNISKAVTAEALGTNDLAGLQVTLLESAIRQPVKFLNKVKECVIDSEHIKQVPSMTPPSMDPAMINLQSQNTHTRVASGANNHHVADSTTQARASPGDNAAKQKRKKEQYEKDKKAKALKGGPVKDYTNAGIIHVKNGALWTDVFPTGLSIKLCGPFMARRFQCTNSGSARKFEHMANWSRFAKADQEKLLKHWDATKVAWLDEDTLKKHNITLADEYAHMVGNASGIKRRT